MHIYIGKITYTIKPKRGDKLSEVMIKCFRHSNYLLIITIFPVIVAIYLFLRLKVGADTKGVIISFKSLLHLNHYEEYDNANKLIIRREIPY